MRLTWRDGAAALAVAAARGHLLSITDRMTEMHGAGERDHTPVWFVVVTSTLGAIALGRGLTATIARSEMMLGVLAQALVALWVPATARQPVAEPMRHVHRLRPCH